VQFKHKQYILVLIGSASHLLLAIFACVYSARKRIIFHFNSWLSFQRLCRLLRDYNGYETYGTTMLSKMSSIVVKLNVLAKKFHAWRSRVFARIANAIAFNPD